MKRETFFEKFELFAAAPHGLEKLRELVLELAVRGQLSSRKPEDSDRDWLSLVAQLDKEATPANSDRPFEIPEGWRWSTLEALGDTKPRNDSSHAAECGFIPMTLISEEYGRAARHELRAWREVKKGYTHIRDGDVVLAKITPCFQNGKSAVISRLPGGLGAGTTELHVFRANRQAVRPEFVLLFIKSRGFLDRGVPRMTGSAGQKRVPHDYFARSPFPLPPHAEQDRIVAKVSELMMLCDRLGSQQREREKRRTTLVQAALARFAAGPTTANLNFLFHDSYAIEPVDLRKSILTLAVQGRLVSKARGDEPASELLKRIADTKVRLQGEGRIAREKPFGPVTEGEAPFELPAGWRWARLVELTELITKGSSPKWQGIAYLSHSAGVLFITSENVGNYHLRKLNELKYVDGRFNEIEPRSILKTGDVLMNLVGASIGRTAIFDLPDGANINQAVALIRLVGVPDGMRPDFLLHYLNSPFAVDSMLSSRVTSAQPNISLTDVRGFVVPVPPLAEQRRIVTRIDELMAKIDQQEAGIASSHAVVYKLTAAIVGELTAQH